MKTLLKMLCVVPVTVAFGLPANAYPIDCAIALCLPGGFPASAECTQAKIEVIRRVTPFPIEPPLQLWRCPMNTGASLPGLDADGLTPELRHYRAGIEVWELHKRSTGGSGGRESTVTAMRNHYDDAGQFVRSGVLRDDIPAWVAAAVQEHAGLPLGSDYGSFRAILFKFEDYRGEASTEWIRY